MKCDDCLHSRRVVSENGLHYICCLPEKETVECILRKKDHKVSITKTEEDK